MRAMVLGVMVLFALPSGTSGADVAAVPLYTPALRTPIEAAGTGLAPEVKVRVRIDLRGRASEVEILEVRPSSDLDEYFERETRDSLRKWRYLPATRDGEPVESTFVWIVQFLPRAAEDSPEEAALSWETMSRGDQAQSYRRRMLSLPVERQRKILQQMVDLAASKMGDGERERFSTPRVVVVTDAPQPGVAETVANNIEILFSVMRDLLGSTIDPYPEAYKVAVFVYASESAFQEFQREGSGIEWSAGVYNPLGLIAFHMEMPSNDSLLDVMFHEATHAYLDRYVARPGVYFPRWLDEGLADYIGGSRIKKKKLVPGKTRRMELYRGPGWAETWRSGPQLGVDAAKRAIRNKKAISLGEMLTASREEFYGEKRRMFYTMSWLLVHFLRHGESDWAEEKFPRLVLYVAEGYPALEAFAQVYGPPENFEERFRDYVKNF